MKYKAVIFDLGGTLTHSSALSEYTEEARRMASVLSAPVDDFVRLWFEQSEGLGTGIFPSYQSYIRHICRQLRLSVQDDLIDLAAGIPFSVTKKHLMIPREGAIEVLLYLKSNGYKTGLITDCAADVPAIWKDTPFAPLIDVAIFSCYVGMNKSNPRIFQLAVKKLAVKPENCLYIADGFRQELANASKLGMNALQIRVPGEIYDNPLWEDWHGPVISSLKEVLTLVE